MVVVVGRSVVGGRWVLVVGGRRVVRVVGELGAAGCNPTVAAQNPPATRKVLATYGLWILNWCLLVRGATPITALRHLH